MSISFRPRLVASAARAVVPTLLLLVGPAGAQVRRPGVAVFGQTVATPRGNILMRKVLSCGTRVSTPDELEAARSALERWRDDHVTMASGGTIRVAFHIITARGEGEVSDARLAEQIQVLNRDYEASGYRFELSSIDRTEQASWFHMTPGSGKEHKAKQALAIDPSRHLNIYVTALGPGLIGWSSLPWSEPEGHFLQGVVLDPITLPGGEAGIFRAASHEVAHYLGLLPAEGVEVAGPMIGENELERMRQVIPVYRPSLFTDPPPAEVLAKPEISPTEGAEPEDGRVLSFRGAFPNPFRAEAALRFTLPASGQVSLRIYSVTGQLVRILVDATLPAGDHSAIFRADGLPSGAYFAVLKAGSVQMNRTLMLIR